MILSYIKITEWKLDFGLLISEQKLCFQIESVAHLNPKHHITVI